MASNLGARQRLEVNRPPIQYHSQTRRRLFRPRSRALWSKVLSGRFRIAESAGSFSDTVKAASANTGPADAGINPLADRMAEGLEKFTHPTLLIMSGNDLTAREFDDAAKVSPRWRKLMTDDRLTRRDLPTADHTFSRQEWRNEVAALTIDWTKNLGP